MSAASRRRTASARPAPEVRRCAIYTRKSTEKGLDQEFSSLDAQRESCEGYIRAQAGAGWQLVPGRYDDGGFTGANLERPAFQRLLQDIDAGKIDIVVVYKVDRLSRSLLDFARVMERFSAGGTAFVSVTQNFSTADAMGRLTLNMLMSFAEFEREMIAERTRDKIAAARRKGKWTGGPVPLGYDVVDKKLVVNELEAIVVREAFDLYLHHRSALRVAELLNEGNRVTKRHRAHSGNTREGQPWQKDTVLRLLKNPLYAGWIPYDGELHEGEHTPLITRDLWHRVRALLDGVRTPAVFGRNPDYILRGLLRCACCRTALTPASTEKNGKEYRYYRSIRRDKEGQSSKCKAKPLPADAIEAFVVERLREATADGTLADKVERGVQARLAARRKELECEHQDLPRQVAALAAEGKRLVESLGEVQSVARRLVEEKLQQVGVQLGRAEASLAAAEAQLAQLDDEQLQASWITGVLRSFGDVWGALTAENRGRVIRCLVERIEVDEAEGKVDIVLHETLAELDGLDEQSDDATPGAVRGAQEEIA